MQINQKETNNTRILVSELMCLVIHGELVGIINQPLK